MWRVSKSREQSADKYAVAYDRNRINIVVGPWIPRQQRSVPIDCGEMRTRNVVDCAEATADVDDRIRDHEDVDDSFDAWVPWKQGAASIDRREMVTRLAVD